MSKKSEAPAALPAKVIVLKARAISVENGFLRWKQGQIVSDPHVIRILHDHGIEYAPC